MDNSLIKKAKSVLKNNLHSGGRYTTPNPKTYPFCWLWDSCFHSLVWADLGNIKMAIAELETVFEHQSEDGFVPHINFSYAKGSVQPGYDWDNWVDMWNGRTESSCITQPPMFGHSIANLIRKGVELEDALIEKAVLGLSFFFKHRQHHPSKLIYLCHPWESGIDDSPRLDAFTNDDWGTIDAFVKSEWDIAKREILKNIKFNEHGSPIFNKDFPVAPVGFSSLVAFNVAELESVGIKTGLDLEFIELVEGLDNCWDNEARTFIDPYYLSYRGSKIKTLDALLPGLVSDYHIEEIGEELLAKEGFSGEYGYSTTNQQEPSFEADKYWRGSSWPQMTYLIWLMGRKWADENEKFALIEKEAREGLVNGVEASGFAEHWDFHTGNGLGATPQSWATLSVLVEKNNK